jgi:hypothetical protein
MWHNLFNGFRLLEGVFLVFAAVGFLKFWARTRFWLPKYVHVLAGFGLIVGALSVWAAPMDAPIKKYGLIARVLLALALPAIIYCYFLFHGGQLVAFNRTHSNSAPCPFCRNPVRTLIPEAQGALTAPEFAEPQCPACGHALF